MGDHPKPKVYKQRFLCDKIKWSIIYDVSRALQRKCERHVECRELRLAAKACRGVYAQGRHMLCADRGEKVTYLKLNVHLAVEGECLEIRRDAELVVFGLYRRRQALEGFRRLGHDVRRWGLLRDR